MVQLNKQLQATEWQGKMESPWALIIYIDIKKEATA